VESYVIGAFTAIRSANAIGVVGVHSNRDL
jgi:hypothetical protein